METTTDDGPKDLQSPVHQAALRLLAAVDDAGPVPTYHADVMQRCERLWPTLFGRIKDLRQALVAEGVIEPT